MKKFFTIIALGAMTMGMSSFGVAEEKAVVVDCYEIAEAAEEAAGGDNFKVFAATFDACYEQL
ncbi:MAG: hypothetical protein ACTIKA_05960 [Psychroflexus halocasei]|uniref:hypothetical protein n=1 Tax=Psychroflexus sp. S27 TaxID=1982757 RepID=UPI000C2969D4|nr:hypothetical protein [Psychroflexus sp. S27]PJX22906.1 hypothetical protein CAP47_07755 [Psychroflexus sp. S27]